MNRSSPPARRTNGLIIAGVVAVGIVAGLIVFRREPARVAEAAPAPAPSATVAVTEATPSAAMLIGRWQRTDGNYALVVREARPDGTLAAEYFNPRPIHVARATWRQEAGKWRAQIELRDVNYPGSIYTLELSPAQDRLTGNYFQAAKGANYPVTLIRATP